MPKTKVHNQESTIALPDIRSERIALRLTGCLGSTLIVHAFSAKAITEMLAKQRGLPVEKQPKDPQVELENAKYRNVLNQECIPAMTLKKSMIEAISFNESLTKKAGRGGFRIFGDVIPIKTRDPATGKVSFACGDVEGQGRVDMVRVGGFGSKTADVRFRPEYFNWFVDVVVDFNPRLVTRDQLVYTAREAGMTIGICEWRPQKDGDHGVFDVEVLDQKEIARIVQECSVERKKLVLPDWVMREVSNDPNALAGAKRAANSRRAATKGLSETNGTAAPAAPTGAE